MIIFARKLLPALSLLLALSLASIALGQEATPIPLATNTPDTPQEVDVPAATPSETEIPATLNNVEQIELGEIVDGTLSAGAPSVIYAFPAKAGDIVIATMTSSEVDAYLLFGDSQGNPLAAADGGAGGPNARLGPFQIPADGSYLVVAESFKYTLAINREVEVGDYQLSVQKLGAKPLAIPGQAEGTLGVDEPLQVYSINGQAGDVLVARMRSEDVDSFLSLTQADKINGFEVKNDDFGAGGNAQVGPTIIPLTGPYLLTASSSASNAQGAYKLAIDRLTPRPISYGDKVGEQLSDENPAVLYTFQGVAGDSINVSVVGEGDLDTTLTVLGPDGAQVAYNDESSGHNPALQGQTLPSDGTYTLVVEPFTAGTYGRFELQIAKA